MAGSSKTTSDHEVIKKWVEKRGGVPTSVKGTGGRTTPGVLRINFQQGTKKDSRLEEISWVEFFKKFDKNRLAFLYQDKTSDGKESRFFKFISREK